jgi:hypothetical protein
MHTAEERTTPRRRRRRRTFASMIAWGENCQAELEMGTKVGSNVCASFFDGAPLA